MSAFTLKLIALVTMIIDHVGAIFFPQFIWLRYIGRLSMPIYAFLVCRATCTHAILTATHCAWVFLLCSPECRMTFYFRGTWLEFQRQNILFTFLTALL